MRRARPAPSHFASRLLTRALVALLVPACAASPGPSTPEPTAEASADVANVVVLPVSAEPRAAQPETTAKAPVEHPGLRDPARANERAPEHFAVRFQTTAGVLEFECTRKNAPRGADRIFNLVKVGFFHDIAFFRVVKEPQPFVIQFGIHGDPSVSERWRDQRLGVDEGGLSNTRGTITFAQAGKPDTRTTQLFINLGDNARLDKMGFTPVCEVTGNGMETIARINGEYGDAPTSQQSRMEREGNDFLRREFPALDYIVDAQLLGP